MYLVFSSELIVMVRKIGNGNPIVSEKNCLLLCSIVLRSRDLKHNYMKVRRSNKQQEASLATTLTSKRPGYFHHYIHDTSLAVRKIIPYSSKTVDLYAICSARWVSAWASVRQDIANNYIESTIRSATQTLNDMLRHCGLCCLNQWCLLAWKSGLFILLTVPMTEEWWYPVIPSIQFYVIFSWLLLVLGGIANCTTHALNGNKSILMGLLHFLAMLCEANQITWCILDTARQQQVIEAEWRIYTSVN